MHGLPEQTVSEALDDLAQALSYHPKHLSWYQLTIEPNTIFHKTQPTLPHEDVSAELEDTGMALLEAHQFQRYEISAFCQADHRAQHNMNYWLFGDYYGIGAGAHGKLSLRAPDNIYRTQKYRQPKDYLDPQKPFLAQQHAALSPETLIFEFMLNTTRLEQAIEHELFTQRTGLNIELLLPKLQKAEALGLLIRDPSQWQITPLGRRFTNDLQALFLT